MPEQVSWLMPALQPADIPLQRGTYSGGTARALNAIPYSPGLYSGTQTAI